MKKLFVIFIFLILAGCSAQENSSTTGEKVLFKTSKGDFTFQLYTDTPITDANFVSLVNEEFYDGLTFHRYEPGFVIQGGDPNGDGTGGSDTTIPLEIAEGKSHTRGTVGMARSTDPDSASSQFFVNLGDNTFLDGGYAVFGEVVDGMDVVDALRAGDIIISAEIIQ